jgi:hypothetical protein
MVTVNCADDALLTNKPIMRRVFLIIAMVQDN